MKKRIISMLLTVLMLLSLFSGLNVNAFADTINGAQTRQYTLGQGDYVLRVCQKLGLNYYTCKEAIMILNNISDGQWSSLSAGRTLTLPASDYDAILIANSAKSTVYNSGVSTAVSSNVSGTASTGTATTGSYTTTTVAANNYKNASGADTLAYYLVPYTMSYGETVSGVCNALGVNFSIFSPFIKQVNNISDWRSVRAGDTIIVPTPVTPGVGTTCYGVMQHKVASSDTAYGIVNSKGVSYNANERLLKVLNQTENLASIKAGGNFFYPVPLTVSVPGTGNPGATVTTTTTTTVTDGNGTTSTQTTTTAKLYKLTSGFAASDGTMLFYVNNQAVTAAPAGAKVTVVTDTFAGKAIQSLTVKHADGKADLLLSGDSFIMPSCDVRVDASIKSGHDINISANYAGKASASVNGISVQSAVKGAVVIIRSADPNYEISSVYASYRKLVSSSTKTPITVSSSNAFIMPDMDVDVEVVLKPVTTYAFYDVSDPNSQGSFYLQVNGSPVTRAAKGAQVTVVANANDGYEPALLKVTNHLTGDVVNTYSNSFTMPGFDVDVYVKFASKGNNIIIMPAQGGTAEAQVGGAVVTEADTNETVTLVAVPDAGYVLDPNDPYEIVRNSDGIKIKVNGNTFKMPKGGVTVTPHFVGEQECEITAAIFVNNKQNTGKYMDCSFSVTVNGKKGEFTMDGQKASDKAVLNSTVTSGQYIDLRYDFSEGVAFIRYEIMVGGKLDEELTNEANLHGYFLMPTTDIVIRAYFETGKVGIGPAVITGVGTVSYKDKNNNSINTCDPNETVTVIVTPGNGFSFDDTKYQSKLVITRKDNGAPVTIKKLSANTYSFVMPAEGVNVQAIFDAKPFVIKMRCEDQVGNNLTGLGLWQVAINWEPGIVDNLTGFDVSGMYTQFEVAYEDYVTVAMTEAGWSNYDMVSFRIDGHEYVADVVNYFYNFQMIEQRAKDLEIVAVLRPRVPVSPVAHALNAIYDVTKGNAEFILLSQHPVTGDPSTTNYAANINGTNYYATVAGTNITNARFTKNAFAGDYVAILAQSVDSMYRLTKDNISIVPYGGDADRIVPTEVNGCRINGDNNGGAGYTLFVFKMPESDVSITLSFSGTRQGLNIHVRDTDGNAVNGMVRLFANSIYRDVAADTTFDDVAYQTQVQVVRSEFALAQGKQIVATDIKTAAGKSVSYTDMSSAGEGVWFTMPDTTVDVYITIGDINYNLTTIVLDKQVSHGDLVFRKSANPNDPVASLADFDIGDTIYIFAEPDPGYKDLDIGGLKVLVNGLNNAANLVKVGASNVWQFKLPAGSIIFQATFEPADAKTVTLTFKLFDTNGGAFPTGTIDVTIDGATAEYTDGQTVKVFEGKTVTITTSMNGYEVYRVLSTSGEGGIGSGNVYTVPDDLTSDTLNVALKNSSNPIVKGTITGGDMVFSLTPMMNTLIDEYTLNTALYIQTTPYAGYESPAADDIIVLNANGTRLAVSYVSPNLYMVSGADLTEGGGILVSTTFATSNKNVTINIQPAGANVGLSAGTLDGIITGTKTIQLPEGTKITVISATDGYDKITITADKGIINGNTYTVTEDNANVTITLDSSKNLIKYETMSHGKVECYEEAGMITHCTERDTGLNVYFAAIPDAGYVLDGQIKIVDKNGAEVGYDTDGSFFMPAGGVKISASFVLSPVDLTIHVYDAGGSPSANTVTVKVGSTTYNAVKDGDKVPVSGGQSVTITPNNSVAWSANGLIATSGKAPSTSGTSRSWTAPATIAATDHLDAYLAS